MAANFTRNYNLIIQKNEGITKGDYRKIVKDIYSCMYLVRGLGELVRGGEVAVQQFPDDLLVARPRRPVQSGPPVRIPKDRSVIK